MSGNTRMLPWLSILIPTFNGEIYLPFALDSILFQEDLDIECIVVDDGSTDATLSIINTYKEKLPLKILQRERQGNWVANTNYALSFAQGEYVCFLHQDDLWQKNRLSAMRALVEKFPNVGFLLHNSNFIDYRGNKLGVWRCPLPTYPKVIPSSLMVEKLLIQNFISIPAPIFKRDIALDVKGLDETLWYAADWDFWLKLAARSSALYYPSSLSGFRIHPSSQTVVRSSYLDDFRSQLELVVQKNVPLLNAPAGFEKRLRNVAAFSVKVNTALAGMYHGQRINLGRLFLAFLLLGPFGWIHYLKDSRIWDRVFARLKARLTAQ